jgi:glycosyltransferase involved in cell wall biosynthesis
LRVLMISKACIVGAYQRKLEELARFPGMELLVAVPPYWREGKGILPLERTYTSGYDLRVLPMVFNGSFHIHFYRGLDALGRHFRAEIMHIDEEPYNLATFQAMRSAQRYKAQALFFTWQNLLRHYPPPFSFFECYNLAHAACAIAGNQEAQEVLRAKGYQGAIHVLPQFGVDPALYRKSQERPADARARFVIGYIGRLVEEKGVHNLLQAVAGLDGDWALRLVGTGPYASHLQALSLQLGIGERVALVGQVPSAEIPRTLNELDVVVLPSLTRRNWKEQFGRILIEAMACEVPVVGSSSGEIPHLIADAGLIFPEGNVEALQHALSKLMHEPELRLGLGRKGRARVLAHYTQQHIAAETYALYQRLLP